MVLACNDSLMHEPDSEEADAEFKYSSVSRRDGVLHGWLAQACLSSSALAGQSHLDVIKDHSTIHTHTQ